MCFSIPWLTVTYSWKQNSIARGSRRGQKEHGFTFIGLASVESS